MDNSCYKCGQIVEQGRPFCLQCGAPQIRVEVPEIEAPQAMNILSDVSLNDAPVLSLDPPNISKPLSTSALSSGIEWHRALRACAIAALVSALVMALGLMVPPLAGLGAGCLAVILYQRRNPVWRGNPRSGAQLGALSGVLFFGYWCVFEVLSMLLFHTGGEHRQKMLEALQQAASRATDPEVQAYFNRMKTPEGLAAMWILFVVFFLLISVAAGGLGGALTGAFVSRRNRL